MSYNINVLRYLIDFFRDVVNSMGKTDQAIAFYKKQINKLCDIGQIDKKHRFLIYRLFKIEGEVPNVNWIKLETDLQQFEYVVNCTSTYACNGDYYTISRKLCAENNVSTLVDSLIKEMFPKPKPKKSIPSYDTYYSCGGGGGRMC